jgi:hypothetical protein
MKLDPRNLPRSYPEMLQDIIALRDRLEKFDGTDARNMAYALGPAAAIAEDQLERLSRNAVKRMLGGDHAI